MKYEWNIIGHQKIIEKLENDLESNNLSSSLLLVGPAEIGKFKVAKTFAKILESGEDYTSNHSICRQIDKNIFSDVISVDTLWQKDYMENFDIIGKTSNFDQSHRKRKNMRTDTISIDDIRAISERIYEKPQANYKICLIKNIHRMNMEAANAFLKLLEEPPERTIFILTANHEKLLPETVVSRTRVLQMNLVGKSILKKYLEKENPGISDEKKDELLNLTQGRPARLQRFLSDPDFLMSEKAGFHEISNLFLQSSLIDKINFADKLSKENTEIIDFFDRFLHFLRSLLIEKISGKNMPISESIKKEKIISLIEETIKAKERIRRNVNKKLVLENLFLEFEN